MQPFVHSLTIERPFGVDANSDNVQDVDEYGQPVRSFDTAYATVQGLIQPKTAREQALTTEAGAEMADHTIYMTRTDITTADRLRDTTTGGTGGLYQVVGIRDHNFGSLAHLAIDARRIVVPALELGS